MRFKYLITCSSSVKLCLSSRSVGLKFDTMQFVDLTVQFYFTCFSKGVKRKTTLFLLPRASLTQFTFSAFLLYKPRTFAFLHSAHHFDWVQSELKTIYLAMQKEIKSLHNRCVSTRSAQTHKRKKLNYGKAECAPAHT
ncbi:unnamed protein product [Clavelina lepadiformis]|uniref:Uncharacterized protein n=1 Tax=Clavelina lepadiformis TaxID=159417 RepID=A0ABP0G9Z3_CLALP